MVPESKMCNKCGIEKPKSEYDTRVDKGYTYLKPYCKVCSKEYNKLLGRSNRQKKRESRATTYCTICGNTLSGLRKKFCSDKCKRKTQHNATYSNQRKRGKMRKEAMIAKMGGKCSICGYSKCLAALEFHHLDPSIKDFGLDSRKFSNTRQEKLDIEAAKCIIVCSNCHAEIHWYKDDEK